MVRYFRVPSIVDVETGEDLGRPERVTREHEYVPDEAGLIAVEDPDDQEAFAAQYTEVVAARDLPAPPPTKARAASSAASTRSEVTS